MNVTKTVERWKLLSGYDWTMSKGKVGRKSLAHRMLAMQPAERLQPLQTWYELVLVGDPFGRELHNVGCLLLFVQLHSKIKPNTSSKKTFAANRFDPPSRAMSQVVLDIEKSTLGLISLLFGQHGEGTGDQ